MLNASLIDDLRRALADPRDPRFVAEVLLVLGALLLAWLATALLLRWLKPHVGARQQPLAELSGFGVCEVTK